MKFLIIACLLLIVGGFVIAEKSPKTQHGNPCTLWWDYTFPSAYTFQKFHDVLQMMIDSQDPKMVAKAQSYIDDPCYAETMAHYGM